jgi:hydrogenase nickel incorporation protein HypB
MCATCGCGHAEQHHDHAHPGAHVDRHEHHHDHEHDHEHDHDAGSNDRLVSLEARVLEKNDRLAAQNRAWLEARGVVAYNLVSSPGAGKTTLLERTVRELGSPVFVIEGDQATSRDADWIRAAGARAVQVNTGTGCHLDAHMIAHALEDLDPPRGSVVLIENVGNLVCPALFDLGERAKVVVASVTEGDDKPIKYPHMFRASDLMLMNKIDLLPYVSFDVDACIRFARQVSPGIEVLQTSATGGDGLAGWYSWLRRRSS